METSSERSEVCGGDAAAAPEASGCSRAPNADARRGIFCREEIDPVREYSQHARTGLDAAEATSGLRGDRAAVLRMWKINGTWHWCSGRGFVGTGASIRLVSRGEAAAAAETQLKAWLGK